MTNIASNASTGLQPGLQGRVLPSAAEREALAQNPTAVRAEDPRRAAPVAKVADARADQNKAEKAPPLVDMQKLRERAQEAIDRLNEQVSKSQRQLGFSVEDKTDRVIVSVFNKQTGELVRQIPAEAVVRVGLSIEQLKGVLFDETL
jgi:flagellar protein FlaG